MRCRFLGMALAANVLCLGAMAEDAHAAGYCETNYPIVLAHGMSGFDSLFGAIDYWYKIPGALEDGDATVFVTEVSQFNNTELRGEQLLAQVEEIVALTGASQVNLIGHSHGGLDVRYVASVRPDLVASVTAVGGPHQGAELADVLRANISPGSPEESVLAFLGNTLGSVIALLSGASHPQNVVGALDSLSSDGLVAFNAIYPEGLPASWCDEGDPEVNGVHYFSWTGTGLLTHMFDISDLILTLTSLVYSEANDGLVGQCSAHLGQVIRDDYKQNHFDQVNHLFGMTHIFSANPTTLYRNHANRLKNLGL